MLVLFVLVAASVGLAVVLAAAAIFAAATAVTLGGLVLGAALVSRPAPIPGPLTYESLKLSSPAPSRSRLDVVSLVGSFFEGVRSR